MLRAMTGVSEPFMEALLDSAFEAKNAENIKKKAEEASKWVQKGMKDDAAKK